MDALLWTGLLLTKSNLTSILCLSDDLIPNSDLDPKPYPYFFPNPNPNHPSTGDCSHYCASPIMWALVWDDMVSFSMNNSANHRHGHRPSTMVDRTKQTNVF